jgi:hypothetical protein
MYAYDMTDAQYRAYMAIQEIVGGDDFIVAYHADLRVYTKGYASGAGTPQRGCYFETGFGDNAVRIYAPSYARLVEAVRNWLEN